jgi:hypothetical protein
MEEGKEVSNGEGLLRKAKLLEDFAAANSKLQMLQDAARTEAKVLDGLVESLRSGGECDQVAISLMLDSYLTGTLADLIRDLWAVCIDMGELERTLSDLGITVPD